MREPLGGIAIAKVSRATEWLCNRCVSVGLRSVRPSEVGPHTVPGSVSVRKTLPRCGEAVASAEGVHQK